MQQDFNMVLFNHLLLIFHAATSKLPCMYALFSLFQLHVQPITPPLISLYE